MTPRKTALVTGGAKRVGRAIVERLAGAGYGVVFSFDKSRAEAESLRDALSGRGVMAACEHVDLSDPNSLTAFIGRADAWCDRLDLLVNCASIYEPDEPDTGPSPVQQGRMFMANCTAAVTLATHLFGKLSVAGGCVVNFLDILAERPWPKYSAYCASKAALHAQTMAMARRFAPRVRVNGIAPGVIDWPDAMPDAHRDAYLARVPLARAGTPQDAAELVLRLAESMPYVTGQVIRLDGGRSLV